MPRYAVSHAIDPMQMLSHDQAQWRVHRFAHDRHVADVEASAQDRPRSRVFRLTNHLNPNELAITLEVIAEEVAQGSRSGSGYAVTGDSEPDAEFDLEDDDLPSEDEDDDLPEPATRASNPSQENRRETDSGGTLL